MGWSTFQLSTIVLRCVNASKRQAVCCMQRNISSRKLSRIGYNYINSQIGLDRIEVTQRINQRYLNTAIKAITVHKNHTGFNFTCPRVITQNYSLDTNNKRTEDAGKDEIKKESNAEKPSLYQRFKTMARGYWYVLLPVHLISSAAWFGGFYYLAKSGVDVVALLEMIGVSEVLINPLRDSSAGYLALSYCLYKIATPLRYTVTLGGTTLSVKYLTKYGFIKPIPPKEKLKEMYQEKKEQFMEHRDNITEEFKQRRDQFKERRENMMREYRDRDKK